MKNVKLILWTLFSLLILVSCHKNAVQPDADEAAVQGALKGEFSVSTTKKVVFAQGNLQYQASTNTWRFADHQVDALNLENQNISSTNTGWIDLFGFGTSGWNNGNLYYKPYDICVTGCNSCGYNYGPTDGNHNYDLDLVGDYANADWGVYNAISNGGNKPGLWRCLTQEELKYLINDRPNAKSYRFISNIEGMNGLIILPDSWTAPASCPEDRTQLTSAQWKDMEAAGAVFLPAAGMRHEKEVWQFGSMGDYWTSTAIGGFSPDAGYALSFVVESGTISYFGRPTRYYGCSVRLVHEVK